MIYLIITNRPHFLPFAIAQAEKCKDANIIILANGDGFSEFTTKHKLIYKSEWRYPSDCFNWFVDNCEIEDDLFLMDDDIYLHGDLTADCKSWIDKGFDRVVYTMAYLHDLRSHKTALTQWEAKRVGGAWAISKDLWQCAKWNDRAIDAMLPYFNKLPAHNLKMIPTPRITHLIHAENVLIRKNIDRYPRKFNFTEPNNSQLINELIQYGLVQ